MVVGAILKGGLILGLTVLFFVGQSCSLLSPPSLEEQKAQILNKDIRLKVQSPQAFLESWGDPTYQQSERTRFYPVKGGGLIPQFRVPLGEVPQGWENSIVSENGFFMAYTQRGELLVFIQDRLVHHEHLTMTSLEEIGKTWEKKSKFRTTLEGSLETSGR